MACWALSRDGSRGREGKVMLGGPEQRESCSAVAWQGPDDLQKKIHFMIPIQLFLGPQVLPSLVRNLSNAFPDPQGFTHNFQGLICVEEGSIPWGCWRLSVDHRALGRAKS